MRPLDTAAFIGKFVEEARDRLKGLSAEVLRLEQAAGADQSVTDTAIGEVLRQAHSLKGSALMLGLTDISRLAHQLEDLFVEAKRDARLLDSAAYDLLFGAFDLLSDRIERLARGDGKPIDAGELDQKMAALLVPGEAGRTLPAAEPAVPRIAALAPRPHGEARGADQPRARAGSSKSQGFRTTHRVTPAGDQTESAQRSRQGGAAGDGSSDERPRGGPEGICRLARRDLPSDARVPRGLQ
jgi:chemotaxis protein histidine kinase CheA